MEDALLPRQIAVDTVTQLVSEGQDVSGLGRPVQENVGW